MRQKSNRHDTGRCHAAVFSKKEMDGQVELNGILEHTQGNMLQKR
jgi:hypothetical protein